MNSRKLLQRLGTSQTNVRFADIVRLALALGFVRDRTKGSHQIFIHRQHKDAILNLQPDGSHAKPYQVRQLLQLVEAYNLRIDDRE
ncbi:MAG: type II toxin-antitoxin system HicA family toxin [Phycisphaeraceae bacterium]|nr:type II toxin-antitoxin system HicA family toxin [Phycisphaeraceae bacterium]